MSLVPDARPGRPSAIIACRDGKLPRKLREVGLGAIADLGFVGLDDGGPGRRPVGDHRLPGRPESDPDTRPEAVQHGTGGPPAPVKHGFAHLSHWPVLGRVRTDAAWATALVRPCWSSRTVQPPDGDQQEYPDREIR